MVKKDFLACGSSTTIKQVRLPVAEAAFFTFVSGVLVGGFVPLRAVVQRPIFKHPGHELGPS